MLSAEHCRPRYVPTEAQRFPRGKAPFARTGRETLHLQQCTLVRRPARVVPACRHSCAPRLRLALSCAAEASQCVGSLVQSRDLESGVAAGGTHAATLTPFASQSRAWSCSQVRRHPRSRATAGRTTLRTANHAACDEALLSTLTPFPAWVSLTDSPRLRPLAAGPCGVTPRRLRIMGDQGGPQRLCI